jgi:hypothetical protein
MLSSCAHTLVAVAAPKAHLLDGVRHAIINHKQVLAGGKGRNHASNCADVIAAGSTQHSSSARTSSVRRERNIIYIHRAVSCPRQQQMCMAEAHSCVCTLLGATACVYTVPAREVCWRGAAWSPVSVRTHL